MSEPADRFWSLCQREPRADLDRFLSQRPPLSPADLAAVIRVEQSALWQAGAPIRVEEYLARFPAVAADAEAALDLIHHEFLLAERCGKAFVAEEFAARFPAHADTLRLQIDLHRAMAGNLTDDPRAFAGSPWNDLTADGPTGGSLEIPVIPGYDVHGEIGRGGMGVVYKARHLALNRDVALKVILSGNLAGSIELVRFRQEAEAVARLDHPNIVQIHEVGSHDGHSYLAMEHVGGGDLSRKIAGVPQPFRDSARLLETLASAVHHAHACGILHRDLKPANVLLTPEGVPKLADFGLARKLDDRSGLTATHAILGTPSFMSPEQARGSKELGPGLDVYGLGAILYMSLTGQPPFLGENGIETLRRVVDDPPVPVTRLRPECPRDLEVICLKCLEKAPGKRYPTAAALADDLHRFLADQAISARPIGRLEKVRRWARRHPGVATLSGLSALLLLVIALGGAGLSLRLQSALGQAERGRDTALLAEAQGKQKLYESLVSEAKAKRLSRRVGQRFGTLDAIRQAVALARELDKSPEEFDELRNLAIAALALPDLEPTSLRVGIPDDPAWNTARREFDPKFRFDAVANTQGDVSLRRLGTDPANLPEVARIPGRGSRATLHWSADGANLAVWHRGVAALEVWKVADDGATKAFEVGDCQAMGFCPVDGQLLVADDESVKRYDPASGQGSVVMPCPKEIGEDIAHHPRLPRFALRRANGVSIYDRTTGQELSRLDMTAAPERLAWHPGGDLLAATTSTHVEVWDVVKSRVNWKLEHRGGGLEVAFNLPGDLLASSGWAGRLKLWNPVNGQRVLQTTGVAWSFGSDDRLSSSASDFWRGSAGPIQRVEAAREYRTLVAGAGESPPVRDYKSCSIHPDGRLVAVGTFQGVGLFDLVTGRELDFIPVPTMMVRFEPTGDLLVNSRAGVHRWPIRIDPDAGHPVRVGPPDRIPVDVAAFVGRVAFSADGKTMAGSIPSLSGAYRWSRDRPEENAHFGPHDDCRTVAVSPDGQWIATGSHNGPGLKVWNARTLELAREFLPKTVVTTPTFSPDGRWLFNNGGQCWSVGDWTEGSRHIGGDAAFAPTPLRLMAWGGHKGFIPLVDPETGREWARLQDPDQDGLDSLTFSPDGTRLFGTTDDSSCVRVWNLRMIRAGLRELGLDWESPAYAPDTPTTPVEPLRVQRVPYDKKKLEPDPSSKK